MRWSQGRTYSPGSDSASASQCSTAVIAWQDALLVKVPNRSLTFIILANSDALAAPFSRGDTWNVTASHFARLFLRVFLP